MSCDCWEQGSIVIPSAAWAGFKAEIRSAWNAQRERRLADVVTLHAAILVEAKGVREANWRLISDAACAKLRGRIANVDLLVSDVFLSKATGPDGRYRAPFSIRGAAGRPDRPRKGDYAPAGNRQTTFELTHASISFDDATRTVEWNVPQNNHAVRDARADPVATAMFAALSRIAWTAGSGGEIVGNDEYNRDAGRENGGGGGSYVTSRYGRDAARGARVPAATSMRASGGAFGSFGSRAW